MSDSTAATDPRRPVETLLIVAVILGLSLLLRPVETPWAERFLCGVVAWLGPSPRWVAPLVVIVVLATVHQVQARPWRFRAKDLLITFGEGVIASAPLIILGVLWRGGALAIDASRAGEFISAAVYEEFLFRLVLVGGGCAALGAFGITKAARSPSHRFEYAILLTAAALFSVAHFRPVGDEAWSAGAFGLRWSAGLYLGWLYRTRGLGVSVLAHATGNLVVLLSDSRPTVL